MIRDLVISFLQNQEQLLNENKDIPDDVRKKRIADIHRVIGELEENGNGKID